MLLLSQPLAHHILPALVRASHLHVNGTARDFVRQVAIVTAHVRDIGRIEYVVPSTPREPLQGLPPAATAARPPAVHEQLR